MRYVFLVHQAPLSQKMKENVIPPDTTPLRSMACNFRDTCFKQNESVIVIAQICVLFCTCLSVAVKAHEATKHRHFKHFINVFRVILGLRYSVTKNFKIKKIKGLSCYLRRDFFIKEYTRHS